MKSTVFAAALVVVSLAATGRAQSLLRGDLVAGVADNFLMCPTPPDVVVFSDDLTAKTEVYGSENIALDGIGRMYALSDVTAPELFVYDTQFHWLRSIDLLEPSSSFTVDDTGRSFVVGESGLVRVYSPEGRLVSSFPLPNVVTPVRNMSIDIAPDRCMLVYTGPHGAVERFDVCAGVALRPAGSGVSAVRALRDGGFAGAIPGKIEYVDRNGRLMSDQPAPTAARVTALAFGAGGETLWIASGSSIFAVRVGAQTVTAESSVELRTVLSLAVFGEQRPAGPAPDGKRRSVRH